LAGGFQLLFGLALLVKLEVLNNDKPEVKISEVEPGNLKGLVIFPKFGLMKIPLSYSDWPDSD